VAGIELKVIADVGLLGLPNAGKSTLIARLCGAAQGRGLSVHGPCTRTWSVDVGQHRSFVMATSPV